MQEASKPTFVGVDQELQCQMVQLGQIELISYLMMLLVLTGHYESC